MTNFTLKPRKTKRKKKKLKTREERVRNAGFWIRLAAAWIDILIIYLGLRFVLPLFSSLPFAVYVPFELTAVVCFLIYSVLLIGWQGRTLGKALCGLTVRSRDNRPVGCWKAFLREAIGKPVSGAFLFLGFLWAGFSGTKRGWHDYLAGTKVTRNLQRGRIASLAFAAVLLASLFPVGEKVYEMAYLGLEIQRMTLPRDVKTPYADRDPSSLIEVSSMTEDDRAEFARWLDSNGKDPLEYAVETAARHRVTIFGDNHKKKEELLFFSRILPALYHRAGVTCVAVEFCTRENNGEIERLVTAPEYDRVLALEIARKMDWPVWGYKEYWDVFETVWKLNKGLEAGQQKLRLVGIDTQWDGASFSLMGAGDDGLRSPLWEKLRIFRALNDVLRLARRDELMAGNIEREIIGKGERGIVWAGRNHSFINYRQPKVYQGKVSGEWGRMGFILHRKYGDDIYQIVLHSGDSSPAGYYKDYHGPEPAMNAFLESVMEKRGNSPVGFDVDGSPFAALRDSGSDYYHFQPGVSFGDVASGYIFLKPYEEMKPSEWLEGYISKKMFLEYKPFYEALVLSRLNKKVRFDNAEEADKYFSEMQGSER